MGLLFGISALSFLADVLVAHFLAVVLVAHSEGLGHYHLALDVALLEQDFADLQSGLPFDLATTLLQPGLEVLVQQSPFEASMDGP